MPTRWVARNGYGLNMRRCLFAWALGCPRYVVQRVVILAKQSNKNIDHKGNLMAEPLKKIKVTHADSVTRPIKHSSVVADEEAVRETLRDINTLDKWFLDVPTEPMRRLGTAQQQRK